MTSTCHKWVDEDNVIVGGSRGARWKGYVLNILGPGVIVDVN